ncbi:hypothetical protein VITU9109_12688 [Vibrio tubiashii ATCC 19109]|uniref:Transposase n=1 Tax=Vibrio tubiashii ATCC 19109 TaxID=1051646 RepID=A0ABN0DK40_9VIBR|nr:hypothetical protein VITU9109_12688 [Vibrio tubiashii ATCC 19109]
MFKIGNRGSRYGPPQQAVQINQRLLQRQNKKVSASNTHKGNLPEAS